MSGLLWEFYLDYFNCFYELEIIVGFVFYRRIVDVGIGDSGWIYGFGIIFGLNFCSMFDFNLGVEVDVLWAYLTNCVIVLM